MALDPLTAITVLKLIKELPGTYNAVKEFINEIDGDNDEELERVLVELEKERAEWDARLAALKGVVDETVS